MKNMASSMTVSAFQSVGSISVTTCAIGPGYLFFSWSFQTAFDPLTGCPFKLFLLLIHIIDLLTRFGGAIVSSRCCLIGALVLGEFNTWWLT